MTFKQRIVQIFLIAVIVGPSLYMTYYFLSDTRPHEVVTTIRHIDTPDGVVTLCSRSDDPEYWSEELCK
jgi:hypothetical protein